jgi:hypothetical protein
MGRNGLTADNVVDFIRYRSGRDRRPGRQEPTGRAVLAPVVPFRVLTEREVAHRERMLAHLAAATAATSC